MRGATVKFLIALCPYLALLAVITIAVPAGAEKEIVQTAPVRMDTPAQLPNKPVYVISLLVGFSNEGEMAKLEQDYEEEVIRRLGDPERVRLRGKRFDDPGICEGVADCDVVVITKISERNYELRVRCKKHQPYVASISVVTPKDLIPRIGRGVKSHEIRWHK